VEDLTSANQQPPQYQGERLAQFTPLQKQGFSTLAGVTPSADTQAAGDLAQQATQQALGTSYDPRTFSAGPGPQQVTSQNFTQPGTAQEYMNPYMQNVVDIQKREATRADDIARTKRNAAAVNAGAYGGSRQAIVESEAGRNLAQQQNDIQAQGANAAFQQAQQQFNADQGRSVTAQTANQNAGLMYGNQDLEAQRLGEASNQFGATLGLQGTQAGIQGAATLAGVGNTEFTQGLQGAQSQITGGTQQQQNVQQGLDQAYGTFQDEKNLPYQQIGFLSDILRGTQGSTRSMYTTPAAPSTLQTLAGLAPLLGGLSQKNSIFGARGGAIKSDAIGRGLARIAPDSVGDFAQGGIIGFAEGGTADWADFDRPPPSRSVGPQQPRRLPFSSATKAAAAEDAAARAAAVEGAAARAAAAEGATAELAPGVARAVIGRAGLPLALGTTALQLYNANQDAYDETGAAKITDTDAGARFAMNGGFTGEVEPPPPPKPEKPAAAPAAPTGIDTGEVEPKSPATAAGAGIGATGVAQIKAPQIDMPTGVGSGPPPQTIAQMLASQKAAGVDYDKLGTEGQAGIDRVGALDVKSAKEEAAGIAALHEKMGQASLKREERLKEQGTTMGGDALIRTGLAILTADPQHGWVNAVASGAKIGFEDYTDRKAKLDASLDTLLEAREQRDFAKGKDILAANKAVRTAERDWQSAKVTFGNALGLKKTENAEAVFKSYEDHVEKAADRANTSGNALLAARTQVQIHNAANALAADTHNAEIEGRLQYGREIYGAGGRGGGAANKQLVPGTAAFETAVRGAVAQLLKAGPVRDAHGNPILDPKLQVQEARRQAIANIQAGGAPAVDATGWGTPVKQPDQ
jgi:hypothetical protein